MTQAARRARGLVRRRQPGPVRRGGAAPGRRRRARVAAALDAAEAMPVRVVLQAGRDLAEAIRRLLLEANAADDCVGVIAWMHTFSPAKMWIAGLDALRKPLLHLHTQSRALPWSEIDMDYMNLQPVGARRPRVRVHPDADGRARARPSPATGRPGGARAGRPLGARRVRLARGRARCASPGSATTCATSPSPRATRSRRSCASASRSTATASAISPTAVADASDAARRRARRRLRGHATTSRRSCAPAARGASRCARPRGSRRGCGRSSTRGRLRRVHRQLRGPSRPAPAARARRAAADGRRLRLRRRGRLEDRGAAAVAKVMAAGLAGGTSFMEDYTYDLGPGRARPRRAHARDLPVDRRRRARAARSTRCRSAAARTRCGSSSTRARPGGRRRDARPRRPLPDGRQRGRRGSAASRCRGSRWRARCGGPGRTSHRGGGWLAAGGPHHTVLTSCAQQGAPDRLGGDAGVELLVIDADTTAAPVRQRDALEPGLLPAAQGF